MSIKICSVCTKFNYIVNMKFFNLICICNMHVCIHVYMSLIGVKIFLIMIIKMYYNTNFVFTITIYNNSNDLM